MMLTNCKFYRELQHITITITINNVENSCIMFSTHKKEFSWIIKVVCEKENLTLVLIHSILSDTPFLALTHI